MASQLAGKKKKIARLGDSAQRENGRSGHKRRGPFTQRALLSRQADEPLLWASHESWINARVWRRSLFGRKETKEQPLIVLFVECSKTGLLVPQTLRSWRIQAHFVASKKWICFRPTIRLTSLPTERHNCCWVASTGLKSCFSAQRNCRKFILSRVMNWKQLIVIVMAPLTVCVCVGSRNVTKMDISNIVSVSLIFQTSVNARVLKREYDWDVQRSRNVELGVYASVSSLYDQINEKTIMDPGPGEYGIMQFTTALRILSLQALNCPRGSDAGD